MSAPDRAGVGVKGLAGPADDPVVSRRLLRRASLVAALLAGWPAAALAAPADPAPPTPLKIQAPPTAQTPPTGPATPTPSHRVSAAELADLTSRARAARVDAERAAAEVFAATARTAHLRVAMDDVAEQHDRAQDALDDRARQVYEAGQPDPMSALRRDLDLTGPGAYRLASARSLTVAAGLVDAVAGRSAATDALRVQADAARVALAPRLSAVYAAEERALALLDTAQAALAAEAASSAAAQRDRFTTQAVQERLALADLSQRVAQAAAPATTARGTVATGKQRAVTDALAAAGPGVPAGYHRTGQRLDGVASSYADSLAGSPTSSGPPYDPLRLTAAMLVLPLGTVVHVTAADGRAVNLLVNDHGPYVDGRLIDISGVGERLLGFDGLTHVTVEVLAPGP